MTEYTVTWQMEVHADNPDEAAMQARMVLLDPESEAVMFSVRMFDSMHGDLPTWRTKDVDLSEVDFTQVEV